MNGAVDLRWAATPFRLTSPLLKSSAATCMIRTSSGRLVAGYEDGLVFIWDALRRVAVGTLVVVGEDGKERLAVSQVCVPAPVRCGFSAHHMPMRRDPGRDPVFVAHGMRISVFSSMTAPHHTQSPPPRPRKPRMQMNAFVGRASHGIRIPLCSGDDAHWRSATAQASEGGWWVLLEACQCDHCRENEPPSGEVDEIGTLDVKLIAINDSSGEDIKHSTMNDSSDPNNTTDGPYRGMRALLTATTDSGWMVIATVWWDWQRRTVEVGAVCTLRVAKSIPMVGALQLQRAWRSVPQRQNRSQDAQQTSQLAETKQPARAGSHGDAAYHGHSASGQDVSHQEQWTDTLLEWCCLTGGWDCILRSRRVVLVWPRADPPVLKVCPVDYELATNSAVDLHKSQSSPVTGNFPVWREVLAARCQVGVPLALGSAKGEGATGPGSGLPSHHPPSVVGCSALPKGRDTAGCVEYVALDSAQFDPPGIWNPPVCSAWTTLHLPVAMPSKSAPGTPSSGSSAVHVVGTVSLLVLGLGDGRIVVMDVCLRRVFTQWRAHDAGVCDMAVMTIPGEDGSTSYMLATVGNDSQVMIWDMGACLDPSRTEHGARPRGLVGYYALLWLRLVWGQHTNVCWWPRCAVQRLLCHPDNDHSVSKRSQLSPAAQCMAAVCNSWVSLTGADFSQTAPPEGTLDVDLVVRWDPKGSSGPSWSLSPHTPPSILCADDEAKMPSGAEASSSAGVCVCCGGVQGEASETPAGAQAPVVAKQRKAKKKRKGQKGRSRPSQRMVADASASKGSGTAVEGKSQGVDPRRGECPCGSMSFPWLSVRVLEQRRNRRKRWRQRCRRQLRQVRQVVYGGMGCVGDSGLGVDGISLARDGEKHRWEMVGGGGAGLGIEGLDGGTMLTFAMAAGIHRGSQLVNYWKLCNRMPVQKDLKTGEQKLQDPSTPSNVTGDAQPSENDGTTKGDVDQDSTAQDGPDGTEDNAEKNGSEAQEVGGGSALRAYPEVALNWPYIGQWIDATAAQQQHRCSESAPDRSSNAVKKAGKSVSSLGRIESISVSSKDNGSHPRASLPEYVAPFPPLLQRMSMANTPCACSFTRIQLPIKTSKQQPIRFTQAMQTHSWVHKLANQRNAGPSTPLNTSGEGQSGAKSGSDTVDVDQCVWLACLCVADVQGNICVWPVTP